MMTASRPALGRAAQLPRCGPCCGGGSAGDTLIRVDVNPASAMVRAAKELRISTIVIGWSGNASPGERIFGSILDQVLEAPPRIAVSRLVRPAAGCKRLVLAVPPCSA